MDRTRFNILLGGIAVLLLFSVVLAGCSQEAPSAAIDADPSLPPGNRLRQPTRPSIRPKISNQPSLVDHTPAIANPTAPAPKPIVKSTLPIPALPPEPLYPPRVVMSYAHADTCLVKVGDTMPEMSLLHQNGQDFLLSQLYGERFTVVVFWDSSRVFALEQFTRLADETAGPFTRYGVSVVAINVGDEPEVVAELDRRFGRNFSSLMDLEGHAISIISTSKLPRTYLLDTKGNILWMDIEYSLGTARQLRNALNYFLQESR